MGKNVRKVTLSLSSSLVADLDYLSKLLGVSRSSLVDELLLEPASELASSFRHLVENPDDPDVRRRVFGDINSMLDCLRDELTEVQNDLPFGE